MAHDLAASIDVKGVGERGAGWIDRGESALVQEKAMLGSGIYVNSHDMAGSVNPGSPGTRGAGNIHRDERAVLQQKTQAHASAVGVAAHDLAHSIDPAGRGRRATWNVDRRKGKCESARRSKHESQDNRQHRANTLRLGHARGSEGPYEGACC